MPPRERKVIIAEMFDVSRQDLGKLCGISDKTISDWIKRGILTRSGRGQFHLLESVQAVCDHLRKERQTKSTTAIGQKLQEMKLKDLELRVAQRNRELVPLQDALDVVKFCELTATRDFHSVPRRCFPSDPKLAAIVEKTLNEVARNIMKRREAAIKSQCDPEAVDLADLRIERDQDAEFMAILNDETDPDDDYED